MTKNRIYIVILLLLSCAFMAAGQAQTVKRVISKTDKLDFGAGGTLTVIGAPKGSIRIEPSSRNEIEISAEITLEAANEADLTTLESVTGFVLDESVGREVITSVGTNDPKYIKQTAKKFPKRLIGLPFTIDYVIKVPRYCDLQIDGGVGDITVSGIEGVMRINSLQGNAKIDLIAGGLNGTFGKGNVFITMPNRSWRGDVIDIALATGEMDVYLPVNLSAELDASILHTGKIENGLVDVKPRVRTVKFTEQSIAGRAGGGGVPMKFTVGDGTLRLKTIGKQQ